MKTTLILTLMFILTPIHSHSQNCKDFDIFQLISSNDIQNLECLVENKPQAVHYKQKPFEEDYIKKLPQNSPEKSWAKRWNKLTHPHDGEIGPVYFASLLGNYQALKFILEHGGDPNETTARNRTPLTVITRRPDIEENSGLLRVLLDHGADPYRKPNDSIFHSTDELIKDQKLFSLLTVVNRFGNLIDPKTEDNFYHIATSQWPPEKTKEFLELADSWSQVNPNFNFTPDLFHKNKEGHTIFLYAAKDVNTLKFFINLIGPDKFDFFTEVVTLQNIGTHRLIDFIIENQNIEVIDFILSNNLVPDLLLIESFGTKNTITYKAALYQHFDVISKIRHHPNFETSLNVPNKNSKKTPCDLINIKIKHLSRKDKKAISGFCGQE